MQRIACCAARARALEERHLAREVPFERLLVGLQHLAPLRALAFQQLQLVSLPERASWNPVTFNDFSSTGYNYRSLPGI